MVPSFTTISPLLLLKQIYRKLCVLLKVFRGEPKAVEWQVLSLGGTGL